MAVVKRRDEPCSMTHIVSRCTDGSFRNAERRLCRLVALALRMPRSQTNVRTCTGFQHETSHITGVPRTNHGDRVGQPAHKPYICLQAPTPLKTTAQNQRRDYRYAQNSVVRQAGDTTVQAVTLHSGGTHVSGRCAVAFGVDATYKDRELAPPTCRMPHLHAYTITKALTSSNLALPPGVTLTG